MNRTRASSLGSSNHTIRLPAQPFLNLLSVDETKKYLQGKYEYLLSTISSYSNKFFGFCVARHKTVLTARFLSNASTSHKTSFVKNHEMNPLATFISKTFRGWCFQDATNAFGWAFQAFRQFTSKVMSVHQFRTHSLKMDRSGISLEKPIFNSTTFEPEASALRTQRSTS